MHSDGVQAAGKIPVDVNALDVDLYSISGHKLYAPKGIGALYVKAGSSLSPILFGGRHERGRRPGTENVPGAVALGSAAEIAEADLAAESARISDLRDRLERGILARVPACGVNGSAAHRCPNTTNIYFDGLEGEALLIALDLKGFAVSSGAASLRFSLGRSNTAEQVDALIDAVADSTAQLRRLSPTYTNA
jgi:cysteine desulfurase